MSDFQHFTLLHERKTPHIQWSAWCPTMDVLAVASGDKTTLFRLSGQRLGAVTQSGQVECMCWSPDGKVVALSHCNGITLYCVENNYSRILSNNNNNSSDGDSSQVVLY